MHPHARRRGFGGRIATAVVAAVVTAWSLLAPTACSAVDRAWVSPDYEDADRTETLRLAVVTAPLPAGRETVGRLWSDVAGRYLGTHGDFVVQAALAAEEMPHSVCDGEVDAVLHLRPLVARRDREVRAEVSGVLWRCRGGETLWRADAAGRWPVRDPRLAALAASYAEALGADVRPYVPATVRLLQATLDTLPHPSRQRDADVGGPRAPGG